MGNGINVKSAECVNLTGNADPVAELITEIRNVADTSLETCKCQDTNGKYRNWMCNGIDRKYLPILPTDHHDNSDDGDCENHKARYPKINPSDGVGEEQCQTNERCTGKKT